MIVCLWRIMVTTLQITQPITSTRSRCPKALLVVSSLGYSSRPCEIRVKRSMGSCSLCETQTKNTAATTSAKSITAAASSRFQQTSKRSLPLAAPMWHLATFTSPGQPCALARAWETYCIVKLCMACFRCFENSTGFVPNRAVNSYLEAVNGLHVVLLCARKATQNLVSLRTYTGHWGQASIQAIRFRSRTLLCAAWSPKDLAKSTCCVMACLALGGIRESGCVSHYEACPRNCS